MGNEASHAVCCPWLTGPGRYWHATTVLHEFPKSWVSQSRGRTEARYSTAFCGRLFFFLGHLYSNWATLLGRSGHDDFKFHVRFCFGHKRLHTRHDRFGCDIGRDRDQDAGTSSWSYRGAADAMMKLRREVGAEAYDIHSLRYTATAELARVGLDDDQIMAITGHKTHRMVQLYAGAERQKTRARAANLARERNKDGT